MYFVRWAAAPLLATLAACAAVPPRQDATELQRQVVQTERAFARTMAQRDHAAFTSFLSDEAVFFSGSRVLRGKPEVAARWKPWFDAAKQPPFSWEPGQVEVLDSGTLALSTGPVRDADGKPAGTFMSIWRLEAAGVWHIVFDKGCDACDCGKP